MTRGTAIGETGADCAVSVEIPDAITFIASLTLQAGELPLKQLPSTADGAEWVALDDID
jgi:hypothetical protein